MNDILDYPAYVLAYYEGLYRPNVALPEHRLNNNYYFHINLLLYQMLKALVSYEPIYTFISYFLDTLSYLHRYTFDMLPTTPQLPVTFICL